MRKNTERMVAISVVVPKSMYEALRTEATKNNEVVADLLRRLLDTHFENKIGKDQHINQQFILSCLRELMQKDALAEAITQQVAAHIDNRYLNNGEIKHNGQEKVPQA